MAVLTDDPLEVRVVDRIAAYFRKTADQRARLPGTFLARYEAGRKVQARIQPKALTWERLKSLGRRTPVVVAMRRVKG
jgi:hypothetical protein